MNWASDFGEGIRIAGEAIRANKLRAGLATLGIVIGVVTVTMMGTAINGLNTAFRDSIAQLGTDVLFIQKFSWGPNQEWWKLRNRRDITLEQARRLRDQVTLARAVSVESMRSSTVSYRDRSARSVWTVGNSEESALVRGLVVGKGRFFSGADVAGGRPVCVLGSELAEKLFPNEPALGKKVRIDALSFVVIGVLEPMGQFLFGNLDNQIIVPITKFVSEMAWRPDIQIMVKVGDPAMMDDAEEELRGIMRKLRKVPPGAPDDFGINRQQILLDTFNKIGGSIAAGGLLITGLALFVGGIGIMNIMFVSVAERTREIGIRKAIGARRRTILIQFLLESAGICLMGGILALAISWPLTVLIGNWLPASLSFPLAGIALAVSTVTGLAAGYIPAHRAASLNPVDALRSE